MFESHPSWRAKTFNHHVPMGPSSWTFPPSFWHSVVYPPLSKCGVSWDRDNAGMEEMRGMALPFSWHGANMWGPSWPITSPMSAYVSLASGDGYHRSKPLPCRQSQKMNQTKPCLAQEPRIWQIHLGLPGNGVHQEAHGLSSSVHHSIPLKEPFWGIPHCRTSYVLSQHNRWLWCCLRKLLPLQTRPHSQWWEENGVYPAVILATLLDPLDTVDIIGYMRIRYIDALALCASLLNEVFWTSLRTSPKSWSTLGTPNFERPRRPESVAWGSFEFRSMVSVSVT